MKEVLIVLGTLVALGHAAAWPRQAPVPPRARLIVLVDMSGSMSTSGGYLVPGSVDGPHLRWVREVEDGLAGAFLPDESLEVMVGTFANSVAFGSRWRTALPDGIQDLRRLVQLGGRSPVVDALDSAIDHLDVRPVAGKRAIAVITDGFNTGNRLRAPDVTARANSMGVRINTLARMYGVQAFTARQRAQQWLGGISAGTGGAHFMCESGARQTTCSSGNSLRTALAIIARSVVDSAQHEGARMPH